MQDNSAYLNSLLLQAQLNPITSHLLQDYTQRITATQLMVGNLTMSEPSLNISYYSSGSFTLVSASLLKVFPQSLISEGRWNASKCQRLLVKEFTLG